MARSDRNVRKVMKTLKYSPAEMRSGRLGGRGGGLLFRGFHTMSCLYTHIYTTYTHIYTYIHIYTHTNIHIYTIHTYSHIYTYIHTNIIYALLYTWPEVHRNVRKVMKPLKYFPAEMRSGRLGGGGGFLFRGFHSMSCLYTHIYTT